MTAGSKVKHTSPFSKKQGEEYLVDASGVLYIRFNSAQAIRTVLSKRPAIFATSVTATGGYTETILAAQGPTMTSVVHGVLLSNISSDAAKFRLYFDETTDTDIFDNTFPGALAVNWNLVGGCVGSADPNKALKLVIPNSANFDMTVHWDVI